MKVLGWRRAGWVSELLFQAAVIAEEMPDGERRYELLAAALDQHIDETETIDCMATALAQIGLRESQGNG